MGLKDNLHNFDYNWQVQTKNELLDQHLMPLIFKHILFESKMIIVSEIVQPCVENN